MRKWGQKEKIVNWFEFELASMGYVGYATLNLRMLCYRKYFFHWSNFLRRLSILPGSKYYLRWSMFYVGHVLFVKWTILHENSLHFHASKKGCDKPLWFWNTRYLSGAFYLHVSFEICFDNLRGYLSSSITSKVKGDFLVDLYSRVIFLTFRMDLISRTGYRWIFHEDLFWWILVLSMFYIFWFFRGLFFNSYPKFSIFQISLFGYKRLGSRLDA